MACSTAARSRRATGNRWRAHRAKRHTPHTGIPQTPCGGVSAPRAAYFVAAPLAPASDVTPHAAAVSARRPRAGGPLSTVGLAKRGFAADTSAPPPLGRTFLEHLRKALTTNGDPDQISRRRIGGADDAPVQETLREGKSDQRREAQAVLREALGAPPARCASDAQASHFLKARLSTRPAPAGRAGRTPVHTRSSPSRAGADRDARQRRPTGVRPNPINPMAFRSAARHRHHATHSAPDPPVFTGERRSARAPLARSPPCD